MWLSPVRPASQVAFPDVLYHYDVAFLQLVVLSQGYYKYRYRVFGEGQLRLATFSADLHTIHALSSTFSINWTFIEPQLRNSLL